MVIHRYLALFFVSLFPLIASAQGFVSSNNRNHPEIIWKQAETEHFIIVYPDYLQGIEAEAAAIAEASYVALSANLKTTFSKKIRIYLSDEDEVVNGSAYPIGTGFTTIWVQLNDFAEVWTGDVKWLRKVLAHELAHIFHFNATAPSHSWLTPPFIPMRYSRPWAEGLAQYQTELWDAQRGDRWLRTAIFEDMRSGNTPSSGRLLYATGNAQLRYLTSTYGDSMLANMLAYRKKILFKKVEVHDFYPSFTKVLGKSYAQFNEEWLKHTNIYYNTMAGQMERTDSLAPKSEPLSASFLLDLVMSSDGRTRVSLVLSSGANAVRSVYVSTATDSAATKFRRKLVYEGAINSNGMSLHPNGSLLAYSRMNRGKNGSMVNDIYLLDLATKKHTRLTYTKRATRPVFNADGSRLAFVVNEGNTSNVVIFDLASRDEVTLTQFARDTQINGLVWNHQRGELVLSLFTHDRRRHLACIAEDGTGLRNIDEADLDNRRPVLSPDGNKLLFTSLRDNVPNVFMHDLETDSTWRVTAVFTGAEALAWTAGDSTNADGYLWVSSTESHRSDRLFKLPASRKANEPTYSIPEAYTRWTRHRPEHEIPFEIAPDPSLIQKESDYISYKNIHRLAAFALPVYWPKTGGIVVGGQWVDPISKHRITLAGLAGQVNGRTDAWMYLNYENRVFTPTITTELFSNIPTIPQFFGADLLTSEQTGAGVRLSFPIDRLENNFITTNWFVQVRHSHFRPLFSGISQDNTLLGVQADRGFQTDFRAFFQWAKQRPGSRNAFNPTDGTSIRIGASGAVPTLGGATSFIRPELAVYQIIPAFGPGKLHTYVRAMVQLGTSFSQDFIGLSRYDNIQLPFLESYFYPFQTLPERVRGYRDYVLGDALVFGTLEYRLPLTQSLNTSILGLVDLGQTSLAPFIDAAFVANASTGQDVHRAGAGVELKNRMRLLGINIDHGLGVAQPAARAFTNDPVDWYYRVRASVVF